MSKCIKTIRAFRMEKILEKGPVQSKKFIPVQLDHPVYTYGTLDTLDT